MGGKLPIRAIRIGVMRIDVQATRRMWRQTVSATVGVALIFLGLIAYFLAQSPVDHQAVRWLILFLLLLPVGLGLCYLIRRLIDRLAA